MASPPCISLMPRKCSRPRTGRSLHMLLCALLNEEASILTIRTYSCCLHKPILHRNVMLTWLLYPIFYENLPRILWVPKFAENRELACHFFSYESVSKDQRLKFMSLPSLPPARSSGHDVAVAATDAVGPRTDGAARPRRRKEGQVFTVILSSKSGWK